MPERARCGLHRSRVPLTWCSRPGDSFVIDQPGLTLVMALRPSNLRVCEPRASALWDGLRDWFGGRMFGGHAAA